MCGITGFWLTTDEAADTSNLDNMTRMLGHRGPDGIKWHRDGAVGLGHARLSIIDLEGGTQPLFAEDGQLALVVNGEIYNYVELRETLEAEGAVFTTHSDCETLLHAYRHYGENFLEKLHGMFAFALYDQRTGTLMLARDRLGIKPLFFAETAAGFHFASEQKVLFPLLTEGLAINPDALLQSLETGFNTGAACIVQGIERVQAGEVALIQQGRLISRRRYWSPLGLSVVPVDATSATARFETLMTQVMHEHTRSDVPFALFLSGGVDSSVVLEWLRREGVEELDAFTASFVDAKNHDDLNAATILAQRYGLKHHVIELDQKSLFEHLPFVVWAACDFIIDHALLPTSLLARETARDFKVVFSGEGGDELFAGYGRYRRTPLQRWLAHAIAPGSGGFRTRGKLGKTGSQDVLEPVLRQRLKAGRQGFIDAWQTTPAHWSDLQKMQYTDLVTELPDQFLVKVDRMLMAWGLEGRVPLLDHRLTEFALSLPDALKLKGREGKLFLKNWIGPIVGEELIRRPKRGFSVPIGTCLTGENLRRIRQVLPRHPALDGLFRPEAVTRLIDRQASQGDAADTLWALLQLALWHRVFIEGKGERPPVFVDPIAFIA